MVPAIRFTSASDTYLIAFQTGRRFGQDKEVWQDQRASDRRAIAETSCALADTELHLEVAAVAIPPAAIPLPP